MIARAVVLSTLILAAGWYSSRAGGVEAVAPRASLVDLPRALGPWTGSVDVPVEQEVRDVLGVDDYINRTYVTPAGQPVNLYIGYYASQRQGDTIHSPQNCLPGAGWQPVEGGRIPLDVNGRQLTVNRYVIQKGLDRQVVLYWYQGRGRVVANEYANKMWLMLDAARLNRSDGALVRIVAPVPRSASGSLAAADAAAAGFTRAVFPRLSAYLP
ncbi:MAG TPA: EpsI family protein [Vicinamibacterales bacterium]|nr:EpsI family protein [Vicinamibacterales bacterium]